MLYLTLFVVSYFVGLAILSVVARPYRMELASLAEELLADYGHDKHARALLERRKNSAYSIRAAPIAMLGYWIGVITPIQTIENAAADFESDYDGLFDDHRLPRLFSCYQASIAAVNPIFGALMFFSKALFIMKILMHVRSKENSDKLLTSSSLSLQP